MSKHTITLGADPEFFVTDRKVEKYIPSCGLFGGEKGHPVILSKEGGYLEDGVAVEFNVTPTDNINELAKRLQGLIAVFGKKFPDYTLHGSAHATFKKEDLRKHPQANVIGCGGDLAAWGVRMPPDIGMFGVSRFAGGHIHIGIDPWPEHITRGDVVRFLDLLVLLPSIKDQDTKRMRFYGSPGLHRETSYGVEWRSPDPYWVFQGSRFKADFHKAHLLLKAVLENKTPIRLDEHISSAVEKYELLETLQEVPFLHSNARPWRNVAASVSAGIQAKLLTSKETQAYERAAVAPPPYVGIKNAFDEPPQPIFTIGGLDEGEI